MSRAPRVLISTYGSAGDLFPLAPIIRELQTEGVEVRCAVPRMLGLYLRPLGIKTIALGAADEIRALSDSAF